MTPQQIRLLRETFARVEPIADVAAAMFYERLFHMDPSVRRLFAETDMAEQGRKLMQTLAVVVRGAHDLEKLVPAVRSLGERHVRYEVRPEHYETVGAALLDTLSEALAADFTPAVRDAWATAYAAVASVMESGSRAARRPAIAAA